MDIFTQKSQLMELYYNYVLTEILCDLPTRSKNAEIPTQTKYNDFAL